MLLSEIDFSLQVWRTGVLAMPEVKIFFEEYFSKTGLLLPGLAFRAYVQSRLYRLFVEKTKE